MDNQSTRIPGHSATQTDLDLFKHIEENLYTAVVSDSLDELGYRNQVLREFIRPLSPNDRFAGWARTFSCVDMYHIPADPYAVEIAALDSVLPGEVVIAATGGSLQNAPWGELLSTAAYVRGARGAVIDGLVRDVRKIHAQGSSNVRGGAPTSGSVDIDGLATRATTIQAALKHHAPGH